MAVEKFRFWCQKVLPLVYDDSLSYYETLCKLSEKINEVIEFANDLEEKILTQVDDKLKEAIDQMHQEMDDYFNIIDKKITDAINQINQLIDEIQKRLDETEQYVDDQLAQQKIWVEQQLNDIKSFVNNQLNSLRDYVDSKDNLIYLYIDEQIQKVIDMIPEITSIMVTNPITGVIEPIQDTLNYLTWVFKYFAYTAADFDREARTADYLDGLKYSAWKWDIYGLKYVREDSRFLMRSPVTGEIVCYKEIIYWLASLHTVSSLTAQAYDDLQLTATAFEALNLTAYRYDFYGTT